MIKFKLIYMKHLKLFSENSLREAFLNSSDYIEPHVSYVLNGGGVRYNKQSLNNYIRIYASGEDVKLLRFLNKENTQNEEVTLKSGWNVLDCNTDYEFSFGLYRNSNLVTDIDMSHFKGDILGRGFMKSSSITSFTIPDTVKIIRNMAFDRVPLRSITISKNIELIQSSFLYYNQYIEEVVFPRDMNVVIERGSFTGMANLKRIVLPHKLETLEQSLLKGCVKLKEVILPENIKNIEPFVFQSCRELETLTLPTTIARIDNNAFLSINSNFSLKILATTPPQIGFGNRCKEILVPREAVDAYKNATNGWEQYKDLIKPIEE